MNEYIYRIIPFYDPDDTDVPGWKYFMIENNGGTVALDTTDKVAGFLVKTWLTQAQHEVMIAHPSVTLAP